MDKKRKRQERIRKKRKKLSPKAGGLVNNNARNSTWSFGLLKNIGLLFIIPLIVFLIGRTIVYYFESGVALNYGGTNNNGGHIFSLTNNGKIDFLVTRAAIGPINQSYESKKTIGEMNSYPLNNGKWTGLEVTLTPLIKKAGVIDNLTNIEINTGETKRIEVDNISRGDMIPFVVEFFISYKIAPRNLFLKSIDTILNTVSLKNSLGYAFFRFDKGKIVDISRPTDWDKFQKEITSRFRYDKN